MDREALRAEAARWMRRARSHLLRAEAERAEGVFWEDLCFDAQQAAELALKALLVDRGIRVPRTHDIAVLLRIAAYSAQTAPSELDEAAGLTVYATLTRYPGPVEAVGEGQYQDAVRLARAIVDWVSGQL